MSQELIVADYHEFFDDHQGQPVVWKTSIDGVTCWHARHPGDRKGNSKGNMLLGPDPPAAGHYVEEHEDDHLTVRPNPPAEPGNSNSILCPICGWHGYIYNGDWQQI
jgi:hypothetical protein